MLKKKLIKRNKDVEEVKSRFARDLAR